MKYFARVPFVAVEVFELDPENAVVRVREHENVLVAQPELFGHVAEAVLVVVPVPVERLPRLSVVVTSMDHLHRRRK